MKYSFSFGYMLQPLEMQEVAFERNVLLMKLYHQLFKCPTPVWGSTKKRFQEWNTHILGKNLNLVLSQRGLLLVSRFIFQLTLFHFDVRLHKKRRFLCWNGHWRAARIAPLWPLAY